MSDHVTVPRDRPPSAPTERTRVRRLPDRGRYDRETIDAILDAAYICHIGYVVDGQPYVTPTAHWRDGDRVYWHGSAASRMVRTLRAGTPICLTVTHLDGLVLARSGFHSSMDYRSAMLLGTATVVEGPARLRALEAFMERLVPGRWAELRPPTAKELKATLVMSMPIDEASAKIRSGGVHDDLEDLDWPVWAGVLPVRSVIGPPEPDPHVPAGMPVPESIRRLTEA
jgi:nitroimidazol reductase NimA-like FMN-containing flavoprotein (pyridoxamine 5'-phosphate oxidase superfamily)